VPARAASGPQMRPRTGVGHLRKGSTGRQRWRRSSGKSWPSMKEPARSQPQLRRVGHQAARSAAVLAAHEPEGGQQGTGGQRDGTEDEAAQRFPAPGVLPGYKSQARGEAKPQVSGQAEACGEGEDPGPGPPRREGAKAHGQALGRGAE
jgi:hypothetical protein